MRPDPQLPTSKPLIDGTNQADLLPRGDQGPTVHGIPVPTRHELTCPARQNARSSHPRPCPICGRTYPDDPDQRKA